MLTRRDAADRIDDRSGGVSKSSSEPEESDADSGGSDTENDDNDGPQDLEELIEAIGDGFNGKDSMSVGDLLDQFGHRAYGPLLAAPSILLLTPVGAIPVLPGAIAAIIFLIGIQGAFGLEHPWIPKFIEKREFSKQAWEKGEGRMKSVAGWIDKILRPRIQWLASDAMKRAIVGLCALMSLTIFPLGFVPFAVMIPAAALLCIGLGMMARDGVLILIGLGAFVVTLVVLINTLVL